MINGQSLFRAYLSFVFVKGLMMGIIASILNVDFYRALILVIVSAIVTGTFGIIIATIQAKESRRVHYRLDKLEITGQEIKSAMGCKYKETDSKPEEKK